MILEASPRPQRVACPKEQMSEELGVGRTQQDTTGNHVDLRLSCIQWRASRKRFQHEPICKEDPQETGKNQQQVKAALSRDLISGLISKAQNTMSQDNIVWWIIFSITGMVSSYLSYNKMHKEP